jgi:sugar phosphate isomerase/epimerase
LLATTHVHDNDGRHDSHHPPGSGTIDWRAWREALDGVRYDGPILLECIRQLRQNIAGYQPRIVNGLLPIGPPADAGT